MLDILATLLGLAIMAIAIYGIWRFSREGPSTPPR